jgi:hypothetical protein
MLENVNRVADLAGVAAQHGIDSRELVKRKLRLAVTYNSSFINESDEFVVVRINNKKDIFPCGSFNEIEDARVRALARIDQELFFSNSENDDASTFHIFTMNGNHIPIDTSKEDLS